MVAIEKDVQFVDNLAIREIHVHHSLAKAVKNDPLHQQNKVNHKHDQVQQPLQLDMSK